MKIIDKYLLKSFLVTFTSVFVILFFIFVLQSIWLFIAELAGKDLDFITIFKFILYYSPIMVPLVLPLSILLASIMTFGSFAENYEFAAMKSGGISLNRAMKYLIFCTLIFSSIGFLFANNIIPEAQYRFINLRKNILQTKPAMAIGEGQFNKIGVTTTIKVDKKSGDNGEFLEGITMHMKKGEFSPVTTIIKAKKGVLKSQEDTNLLQLDLLDGNYYEDIQPQKIEERQKMPFAKSSFKKYTINIDLAKLNATSGDAGGEIVNAHNMLTMGELKYTIDSLQRNYNKDVVSYSDNIDQKSQSLTSVLQSNIPAPTPIAKNNGNTTDILSLFPKENQTLLIEVAKSNVSNTIFSLDNYNTDLEMKKKYINDFWIAYFDKIIIAYSCLLMFFIGAPLGAIIRKGGIGLPIVFAVLIFITFNFANTFGKKLAGQDAIHPFIGVAAGAIILTPFALLFTYRATNDMGLTIDFDWLVNPIKNLFSKPNSNDLIDKFKIVSLDTMTINEDDQDYSELLNKETIILENIVMSSLQFNFSNSYRLKTLKVLESRGITQEELELKGKLYDREYLRLIRTVEEYKNTSKLVFVFSVLNLIFSILISTKIFFSVLALITLILIYYYVYISALSLNKVKKITGNDSLTSPLIMVLCGFPFYILIYLYNKSKIDEIISTFKK